MKLTPLVARFVEMQNTFDSEAYVTCFTDTAIVHDEGKAHTGLPNAAAYHILTLA